MAIGSAYFSKDAALNSLSIGDIADAFSAKPSAACQPIAVLFFVVVSVLPVLHFRHVFRVLTIFNDVWPTKKGETLSPCLLVPVGDCAAPAAPGHHQAESMQRKRSGKQS